MHLESNLCHSLGHLLLKLIAQYTLKQWFLDVDLGPQSAPPECMAPSPKPARQTRNPERERDHERRRRYHGREVSTDEVLLKERIPRDDERRRRRRTNRPPEPASTVTTSNALSTGALAQLDALNEKVGWQEYGQEYARVDHEEQEMRRPERVRPRQHRVREHKEQHDDRYRVSKQEQRHRRDDRDHNHYRERETQERRVVSGPLAEEGGVRRGHHRNDRYDEKRSHRRAGKPSEDNDDRARRKKKKRKWIIIISVILLLIIIISVAVGVSKIKSSSASSDGSSDGSKPANSNIKGISPSSIPAAAKGTYLDPFTWYDTTDFNVTYTNETIGGLPLMGLMTKYDNSVRANPDVPPINSKWNYANGAQKIHGMNLGGWLSIEPFITPSLFNQFSTVDGVIDEWTLAAKLGPTQAAAQLEKHYSSFITKSDIANIAKAGFDHVRISYSYWAVTTYPGDPYVPKISFRYLLRGIEYARQNGLRVNLDLHGLPGSQNGWNHSGRQGPIGWLNGTDGALNAQRSIDIHKQLAAFFSQPRYDGLVTMYGLANEPKMIALDTASVVTWSADAITAVRGAGLSDDVIIVIGDGFLGLANWAGSSLSASNTLLDAHQYVIFNVAQVVLSHADKITFACNGWTQQSTQSMSSATGFGSFLCGEWSQADTDCQTYLNNVGWGNRWEGTYNTGNASDSVLTPTCPTAGQNGAKACSCAGANADPSSYSSTYKQWLKMFAEAQMHSFEVGWGWFYWTWKTDTATQWSYALGMQAGILPTDVRDRDFDCSQDVPDFSNLGLLENY